MSFPPLLRRFPHTGNPSAVQPFAPSKSASPPTHPTPSTVASFQPPTTYLHYPDCHTATALATKDIIRTAEIILQCTSPVAVQYLVLFNRSPQFPQNRCPGAEELV